MNKLFLYNTLSRKKEEFKPIKTSPRPSPSKGEGAVVGLYTCGPTVYNYAHLGNLRAYLFEDVLKRVLLYNGYKVKHVMNITDVGHLSGDRDMGEDKLEVGAKREHKTAWQIAEFYTEAFKYDIKRLNILAPNIWCKATDYIKEQINLIKILEAKDWTYKTSDGIYYDTAKFKDYTKLSRQNLEALKEGARVEKNEEKKNATDFALWKFSYKIPLTPFNKGGNNPPNPLYQGGEVKKRQMEWASPWGVGFPGWHIECSAMSLALLKRQRDIHCGGVDHINVHHTNEIAQSEAATGEKFFNFWLHGAFLNISGGKKMAKSAENFLTVEKALTEKGIKPLAYRFMALGTHYRKPMEYSEAGILNAEKGLKHLYNQIRELRIKNYELRITNKDIDNRFKKKFLAVVNDDLNMPQALAVVQELLKSKLMNNKKLVTIFDFDRVLGLDLAKALKQAEVSEEIEKMLEARERARQKKDFKQADRLRQEIKEFGYIVEDTKEGQRTTRK